MADYNLRARSRSVRPVVPPRPSPETVRRMSRTELVSLARNLNSFRGVVSTTQGYISKNKVVNGKNVPKSREDLLEEIIDILGYAPQERPLAGPSAGRRIQDVDDDDIVFMGAGQSTPRRQPLIENVNHAVASPSMNPRTIDPLALYPAPHHQAYYNVAGPSRSTPTPAEALVCKNLGPRLEVFADKLRNIDDMERQLMNSQKQVKELEAKNKELTERAASLESALAQPGSRSEWSTTILEKLEREIECPICLEEV
ncbi:hypothetical protein FRC03_010730, partial [Tulasnella sp. 419]